MLDELTRRGIIVLVVLLIFGSMLTIGAVDWFADHVIYRDWDRAASAPKGYLQRSISQRATR